VKIGRPASALCRALARNGGDVRLFSAEDPGESPIQDVAHERFAQDFSRVPVLNRLRASRQMSRALREADVDIVHTHGLWSVVNLYRGRCGGAAPHHVISPRGMLHPAALAFSPLQKRLFDGLLQRRVLRSAHLFHATSADEAEHIRACGLLNPIVVVPNGIDVPDQSPVPVVSGPRRTILSLGRIHPKKGLDRLVAAWAEVADEFPHWDLRIVGPEERGHAGALRALGRRLCVSRMSVTGPVYGEEKHALYRSASLFVLPTLGENFAMTVAESLAAATPVISTKGAPWAGLEQNRCGWWIDHGKAPLAAALKTAMTLPDAERTAMGERGRRWMARSFSWDRFARDMLDAYRWIREDGRPPEHLCVAEARVPRRGGFYPSPACRPERRAGAALTAIAPPPLPGRRGSW